ncbi:MAG: methylenetetrahydrofolate--tRNA-(uracil(54)-C(5))-methyltransferase (FADH(2)-oxidizing) TrmFO [Clostridiales bacterium]|jgi:methylenetetrahydrofolate--tRNA-(uracil-5-)-methyltransferase|nr:methylenetetrahydrofolate--tRNA-(uracil(54)-C(5))-methyltransferase (FADH(2)-oxidizing) TrmFO [Clostridiales bacterium]HOB64512.1 methylenetetrahydrofolate--tRNA-(uracil(54)-C(5))-methyltransferase (FADH(2)-oxidizing) TrmFO [Clostridia bacterium]HPO53169.1 methylenetetrahydrofolate--tRNA-(uracil(54)-C(5))-methyltransferase (FADH(2)-oxidizing) TrmFO [Clostridia bacterium]
MSRVKVIGGGLAGAEACYKLAKAGIEVDLYEMRPVKMTPAHTTDGLAELVCSNSLKSEDITTAQGLLKAEMRELDSVILQAAGIARVPAGGALAVDRALFSQAVENIIKSTGKINIIRQECASIDNNTIVATGPLTSDAMAEEIKKLTGAEYLHFFDAVAPIITAESVDMSKAYYGARYGKGSADYLNCPMDEGEYKNFIKELVGAATVVLKSFEKGDVFEGCMPVEVLAARGEDSLRFGPLRPVGLKSPDGKKAYAVVQLRKEDRYDSMLNLVGFQTNLTFPEQRRVFRLIPALANAEFVRYGVMHRNTYINSPEALTITLNPKNSPDIFFAGQITGVEGYMESAMTGMLAAIHMLRRLKGKDPVAPPETTMCGSLCKYIATAKGGFAPMHVSFELVSPIERRIKDKAERRKALADRALKDIKEYKNTVLQDIEVSL